MKDCKKDLIENAQAGREIKNSHELFWNLRQPVRPNYKGAHGIAELAVQSFLPQIIMVI